MNNYYIYQISYFSSEYLLKKLKKIKVSKLKKIDTYLYEVTINIIYHKEFKKLFPDAKLVKKKGIYFLIKEKLLKKLTIISLLIGLIFYLFLLSLIYRVDIKGNNQRINENILIVLNENKIYKYQKIPSLNTLEKVKEEIILQNEEIENLDYKVKGTIIIFTYYLKEKEIKHYQQFGKYYAKKDGMIKYADIECGNYLFSSNQYVKQGELLIDDYLYVNDKSIYLGGYGKVYAYTWSMINLKIKTNSYSEVDAYTYLVDKARYSLCKKFTDDEKIEEEYILAFSYQKDYSSIKIHYTLLENIAILI